MKIRWVFKFIAVILLLVSCGTVFADCHGDCFGNIGDNCNDCSDTCNHACRCAVVQYTTIAFISTYSDYTPDKTVYVPHMSVTDIFRPPNTLA